MVNYIFNICEEGLYSFSNLLGISYETLNVIILFLLIIHTIVTYYYVIFLYRQLLNHQKEVKQQVGLHLP